MTTIASQNKYKYLSDLDALTVSVKESDSRRAVYRKGEWATPVLDEPYVYFSIRQLEDLLKDALSPYFASDYIDDRDAEIDKLLRRKQYKR